MTEYERTIERLKAEGKYDYDPAMDTADYKKMTITAITSISPRLSSFAEEIFKPAFDNIGADIKDIEKLDLTPDGWRKLFYDCYLHAQAAFNDADVADMYGWSDTTKEGEIVGEFRDEVVLEEHYYINNDGKRVNMVESIYCRPRSKDSPIDGYKANLQDVRRYFGIID